MHSPGCHSGTLTAIPRFSKALVPDGKVPSSLPLKALTGRSSPLRAFMGSITSRMNSGISLVSFCFLISILAQAAGTSTFVTALPLSTAELFHLYNVFTLSSIAFLDESLHLIFSFFIGYHIRHLKKAACIMVLVLVPRPSSSAIAVALII